MSVGDLSALTDEMAERNRAAERRGRARVG